MLSFIIPAHNEEKVIRQKLESVRSSNFPMEKIQLLIGADNCASGPIGDVAP